MKLFFLKILAVLIMSGTAITLTAATDPAQINLAHNESQDANEASEQNVEDEEGKQEDSVLKKKKVEDEDIEDPDNDGDKG